MAITYPIVVTGSNNSYTAYIIVDGVELHHLTGKTEDIARNKAIRFMKRMCPYCYRYVDVGNGTKMPAGFYHYTCLREIDYN